MQRFLPLCLLCLFAASFVGCAHFSSRQTETAPDGTTRVTHIAVTTFFDAHNEIAKLRANTSDKTQGLSLGSVSENASSTNTVEILRHIAAIVGAAAK